MAMIWSYGAANASWPGSTISRSKAARILYRIAGSGPRSSALGPKYIRRTVGYPTVSAQLTGYCLCLRPPWSITEFALRYW